MNVRSLLRIVALVVMMLGLMGCVGMQIHREPPMTLTFVELPIEQIEQTPMQAPELTVPTVTLPKPLRALNEYASINPTQAEMTCMATAMIAEAGGEGDIGMIAVGYVLLNRAGTHALNPKKFRGTACGVVYQKDRLRSGRTGCQFSWVCQSGHRPANQHKKYTRALYLAERVMRREVDNPIDDSVFFNVSRLRPSHVRNLPRRAVIGGHSFYAAI